MGFSKREIVETVSKEARNCESTVYRDFRLRGAWQPKLQELDPDKSLLMSINRYDEQYRRLAWVYLNAHNNSERIGAINGMRAITEARLKLTNPHLELGPIVGTERIELHWKEPEKVET